MSSSQQNKISYELHSLGWKSFQLLCSTIVSELWGQTIQIFFDSYDGGRDGAFHGEWADTQNQSFSGSFTVQCKHTAKQNAQIKLSDLGEELEKAGRLAKKGLSDNYFLFTNAHLTGVNDEEICAEFQKLPGLKKCAVYGGERVSQIIHESKRLRMLVPRIYGLGDLSQILDDRAYDQAQEILSSLGDDLNKFIITDAYRQSTRALTEHGFVLLLGEPMCGKSTIAAALSMGALDEWNCSTIKVRDADEFVQHFNPNEKQLFWVDDAFGATQLDWSSAINWSKTFPHVMAAIHKGAKVIFTSRDYIYRSARKHLKESALPLIKESQVVIQVEKLTTSERQQILYNHIRLGNQTKEYKKKIKRHLDALAAHDNFSPEIARRLGNSVFTKNLPISEHSLCNFVEKPLEMLCEVIETIGDSSRSALALVFMRGGSLTSPVEISDQEKQAIERLGGSEGEAITSLESLNESLVVNTIQDGSYSWKFKHPTVRDAFAAMVATSPDLMDIYLKGAPLKTLFSEISCGDMGISGVSVIVPESQFELVIEKILALNLSNWVNKSALCRFLSYRCSKAFLAYFLAHFPSFISTLQVGSYLYADSDVDLLVRLNQVQLLPEDHRESAISSIKAVAVETPDAGFLSPRINSLLTAEERADIIVHVREELIPNLGNTITQWQFNYNADEEPEAYFDDLRSALEAYKEEFEGENTELGHIESALDHIEELIVDLQSEYHPEEEENFWKGSEDKKIDNDSERSIFDDVDA